MKKIIWTCDTEIGEFGNGIDDAFSLFVLGHVSGCDVGVNYINDKADKYGAKVTHFVDIYQPRYTKEFVAICEKILSDGHKVELHTHPSIMYKKRYMYEYDLSEQKRIIEYGQNFFWKFLRLEPTAHRAVGYSANDNTMKALHEAGIKVDSSCYHGNKFSMLNIKEINSIGYYQNTSVLEVPVTVFSVKKRFLGVKKSHWQKLDFRNGSNVEEILKVIDLAPKNAVIILFLHSVNFLKRLYSHRSKKIIDVSIDYDLLKQYELLLNKISSRKDCCWKTIEDIYKEQEGFFAEIDRPINICQSLKKRFSNEIYV